MEIFEKFILAHSLAPEPVLSDLVALGILEKPISDFTNADIGTEISIPYTDAGGVISGPIVFEVVGVNHHTNFRHRQTITLMSKDIIRYVAFDAKEPNNPDSNRAQYGNNRWSVSNIRQWLNSSGAANSWFTPKHDYDEPPTADNLNIANGAYADEPGFLAGFSNDVLQHFTNIRNTTIVPTIDGGGSEITIDKVFLASFTEMGFGNIISSIPEGTHLSIRYPDDNSRIKSSAVGSNTYYLLRSPYFESDSYHPKIVREDGSSCPRCGILANYGSDGLVPLIVLH